MTKYIKEIGVSNIYVPNRETIADLQNRFSYHKPIVSQPQRYEEIRAKAMELAVFLLERCPESREFSLAMTNLEQAIMWANASIARNEEKLGEE